MCRFLSLRGGAEYAQRVPAQPLTHVFQKTCTPPMNEGVLLSLSTGIYSAKGPECL